MKRIWKIFPALAPVLAMGGVAVGAACGLDGYAVPAYGAEDFKIPGGMENVPAGAADEQETADRAVETKSVKAADQSVQEETKGSFQLEDGTYEGTGTGFHGEIKVSVKVQDQSIDTIEVLSHSDDEAFFNRAKEGVVSSILSRQTTEVDTVTGATYSSKGIIQAVKNALTGEKGEGNTEKDGSQNASQVNSQGSVLAGKGDFPYADGTYEGSAPGFSGEVRVSVTVKDKTITAIDILSHSDDESFFARARDGVVASILSAQKLEVDAVSGATYSSNGIINAVKNALSGAKSLEGEQGNGDTPAASPVPAEKVKEPKAYQDGTYTGTGTGFGGKLTVKVKISGGKIKKIQITNTSDGEEYIKKAKALLKTICAEQSTNVDTVSGATYSSAGIIEAVRNALAKAAVSKSTPVPSKKPAVPSASPPLGSETQKGAFPYPDGTYTGTGEGFGGKITVEVTIKNSAVTKVAVTGHADEDDAFFNRAQVLTDQIVKKQSVDVDTVTGATYSSRGILEGVKNALKAAEQASVTGTPAVTGPPSVTGQPSVTGTPPASETPLPTETPGAGGTVYKDGLYSASALCSPDEYWDFDPYNLNLTVVLSGGRITAIRNIYGDYDDDAADNDSYVNRAANGSSSTAGVVSQILEKNGVEGIDTVSHATCSSQAIIEACRQALQKAQ